MRYVKLGVICAVILAIILVVIVLITTVISSLFGKKNTSENRAEALKKELTITESLLKNEYSRPQVKLDEVKEIVIHYTGSSGTTASERKSYFEGIKESDSPQSSHFIVGLNGEIIQCIPTNEVAYATLAKNKNTIAIEYCHEERDGAIDEKEYESLVKLTAWLMEKFGLKKENIIRHSDVNKEISCPKYFAENKEEWTKFLNDVQSASDASIKKK